MLPYADITRAQAWPARLRRWIVPAALTVALVAFGAAALAPGNARAMPALQATATGGPGLHCETTFSDDFPYGDGKVTSLVDVVVGGEEYTSTPPGTPGVRLRDFYDTLIASSRPGGSNYGGPADPLSGWNSYANHGFSFRADGDNGIRMGGTGNCTVCPPLHENNAGLGKSFQSPAPTFTFRASADLRVDEAWGLGSIYDGGAGLQVIGLNGDFTPPHDIVFSPGAAGGPNGNIGPNGQVAMWDGTSLTPLWNYTFMHPLDTGWHRVGIYNKPMYTAAYFDAQTYVSDWQGSIQALTQYQLAVSVRYTGAHYLVHYKNFLMNWVASGELGSIAIPLPAGATQYGMFNATDNGVGAVRYWVRGAAGGAWIEVQPGADLSILNLAAPIRLRATINRNAELPAQVTDPVPALLGWSVDTCSPATPTPTATRPPRTPTPSSTPRPSPTPRPTSTPGGYFQVAPLRPAIHLKVDPLLDPPAPPGDQSDWRESDAVYYPLQVYAGLVPFAYADPAQPPRLCYWNGSGWTCVNGTIQLKSYILHGILMDGIDYLDEKVEVPYARTHYYQRWPIWQYRYDPGEYTFVSWLAPDGVVPQCSYNMRCVHLTGASAGNYQIVYDVIGNIHWNAIPGVGGPYDYGFTSTMVAPISIVMPRAEP